MLEVVIAVLIALSTGTACELGTSVDWYKWVHENDNTAKRIMGVYPKDNQDAWLFQEANGDYLLFVFREKVDETLASGRSDPHGECARVIKAG